MNRSLGRKFINYVLNGLLITVPVAVTVYVVYRIFTFLDNLIPGEREYPGLGILLLIVVLFVLGWLGSKFINEPIKQSFDKFLDRIPLIKTLYKSLNDVLSAFVGSKKRFDQPVLVRLSDHADAEVIGFITDSDLRELGPVAEGKVAVYVPMSYSISGHLIIVPAKNIKRIEQNPVDIMKYVISGGVAELETDEDHGKV
jgi:uncharacterized membrane protein